MLEGNLRLGLHPEAFSRSAELAERYPVDQATGLRWMELPLGGTIYQIGEQLEKEILNRNRSE